MDKIVHTWMLLFVFYTGLNSKGARSEDYDFKPFNNPKYTWIQANGSCTQLGGMLAILDTQEKITYLKNTLKKNDYWVGLREVNGKEKWANGKELTRPLIDKKNHNKKCATFKSSHSKFEAKKCDERRSFVCQDTSGKIITSTSSYSSSSASLDLKPSSSGLEILFSSSTQSVVQYTVPSTNYNPYTMPIIHSSPLKTKDQKPSHSGLEISFPSSTQTVVQYTVPSTNYNPNTVPTIQLSRLKTIGASNTPASTNFVAERTESLSATRTILQDVINSRLSTSSRIKPSSTSSINSRQKGKKMIEQFNVFLTNLNAKDPSSMKNLLDEYDDLIVDIEQLPIEKEDFNPLLEAQSIEIFALEFSKAHLSSNRTTMEFMNNKIAYRAQVIQKSTNSNVIFPVNRENNSDFFLIPKSLFKSQEETFLVGVMFKNQLVRNLTPSTFAESNAKYMKLNTQIFSLSTYPELSGPFREKVAIKFKLIQENVTTDPSRIHCSFWNFSIPSSHNGSWSSQGCTIKSLTATHTVCECNHMTNFAVLMQLDSNKQVDTKHTVALTIISYVGLVLSLLGEIITVLCYCIFLNISNEKIQIRLNLLCTLAGAQIVILAGTNSTKNKGVCVFVAAFIHYLYLVSFCWMLMEGVYLYRMVVKVFDTEVKMCLSYIFSYGCPAFMVALALILAELTAGGIDTFSNPNFCWVNFKNKLIWTFVVPVLLIVVINSILLFCVIKEMFHMKSLKTISSLDVTMIRAGCRACVVLLPLLGITWVFGLLSLANIGVAWQYIFTILNVTQGFFIFIFHCLKNTELRAIIRLRFTQWESNHSNPSNHGKVTPEPNTNRAAKFNNIMNSPCSFPMEINRQNSVIPDINRPNSVIPDINRPNSVIPDVKNAEPETNRY